MATTKLIPLAEQPEYQAAIGKVAQISAALNNTTERLQQLQNELFHIQNRPADADDAKAMDRALAIAEGTTSGAFLPSADLKAEIDRLTREQKVLRGGLVAANAAADVIAQSLSRAAGAQAKARHVEATKRVLECLEQLCRANEAEEQIRSELMRLGYDSHGLPNFGFVATGRIDDWTGSPAYYFNKEVTQYINGK